MDPFRTLQSRAAEKRDQAIADARREYRKDIEAIERLEKRLPAPLTAIDRSQPLGKPPTITDMIRADFCRKHEALKGWTPAMASRLADKPWTIRELLERAAEAA
jgi:hypothetical protein